ncbi:HK97-gp10 family putative phage morphogenesis protein [Proteinivorax tanatarense]|uniref:HK97-gp10 family putative phage morphogenesis protein n=1 Tax=Proteinivorax tanatarense TaxID=1260629 RepID=A0AAU7VQQ8_9FIRM
MELEGMEELISAVEKMGKAGERIENKALREAGDVIQNAIVEEAPERTGTLKRSIRRSGVRTKEGMKHVQIGPGNAGWYAKFLEFGTVYTKANPFMSRGYEQSKDKAMEKISWELKKGLGLR